MKKYDFQYDESDSEVKTKKKPKKSRNITGAIILVLLIACASIAIIFSGVKLLSGKSLPSLIGGLFGRNVITEKDDDTDIDDDSLPTLSQSEGREKGQYNFLFVGVNSVFGNNTDMIAVVNYDAIKHKANVVQIPRDTYFSEGNYSFHKLNSYYTAAYNSAISAKKPKPDAIKEGAEALCGFVSKALGIEIDRYVYIDTVGLAAIVDSLGGVEIDVPFDMVYQDPDQNLYINIKAGRQTLDGVSAQQFVRFRSGYANADYGRMDAQKIFICALLNQIKANFNASTIVNLANAAMGNVSTSLSSSEFIFFASKAYSLDFENVTFATLPTSGVYSSSDRLWYEVVNKKGATKVVGDYLNVFKGDYTADQFDSQKLLVNEGDASILGAYNAITGADPGNAKSGKDILDGSISIPSK